MNNNQTLNFPNYQTTECIHQGKKSLVYRAQRISDNQPVILKLLRSEYPSFNELIQFRHQYIITQNLNLSGIVQPLGLENYRNSLILVMGNEGYISLDEYTQENSLSLSQCLTIGIKLASILAGLYHHRIIHKDIKPANILIHPATFEIQLIDFSIASLLPKETQVLKNPNILEGTLAYISPEQTGRMNRGIDYRSDFYSFGVTLYELFSGKLPFETTDAMELVHCHIAKVPPALEMGREEIPQTLSNIVMKLMAKNAEERYQSAWGIQKDLETCLEQLENTGKIELFEIGKQDICDHFIIPEKLYGRHSQVKQLLDAFERVANPLSYQSSVQKEQILSQSSQLSTARQDLASPVKLTAKYPLVSPLSSEGGAEMMLVAGYSGVGKTAVVNEVHKPIVRQRGYFIKGKYDQFQRNIPFSAFVQALRDLMGQLLSENDTKLQQWKDKILKAVGENGQVIIEVIPELEKIVGKQPSVTELSGTAAQNRFNLLFQKFIQVFTTKEHPLVIFLDDLQWADSASLNLIKLLMSEADSQYLFLIGAYRDNEVSPAHPLMLTLDEIQKNDAIINTITLAPLGQEDLNQLVADTLHCSLPQALLLTEAVYQKTQGNPFFATQFLKALYEDKLIYFNSEEGFWQCDLALVKLAAVSEDVVEFVGKRLQKLNSATQDVLKLAACIGNEFDLKTLAIVQETSELETATDLWVALKEGLILPTTEVYKFYTDATTEMNPVQGSQISASYKFLHDRVQQAACSLIPEAKKQKTHLMIGRRLLQQTQQLEKIPNLFEITNHLNLGADLLKTIHEREELIQLNLIAGRRAKTAAAYKTAAVYFKHGLSLLPNFAWESHYSLTLSLHREAAEATYLSAEFEAMEGFISAVHHHGKTLLDKIKVYEVQIQAYIAKDRLSEAIKCGLQVLKQLDVNLPQTPKSTDFDVAIQRTFCNLAGREPGDLLDLPTMTDSSHLAVIRILKCLFPCAYQAAPMLLPLLVMEQVNLSMLHGNTALSASGYVYFGLILCGIIGDTQTGYQFGQLALALVDRLNAKTVLAESLFIVNADILHYQDHVSITLPALQQAYSIGLETGNLEFSSLATYIYAYHAYARGQNLAQLNQEIARYNEIWQQLKQQNVLNMNQTLQQAIANLLGESPQPCYLNGEIYDQSVMLPIHQQDNNATAIYYVYFNQMILCYLLGNFSQAASYAQETERYLHGVTANLVVPLFYFYDSLCQLPFYNTQENSSKLSALLTKVEDNQKKMEHWAKYAPMNFQHKYDLVQAEKNQVLGQKLEAMELYDKAIAGAKENKYIQEEALANELAAKFYLELGRKKVAQTYMIDAYYCYSHWGAKAKVKDLEQRYPQLLAPILEQQKVSLNPFKTITSLGKTNSHSQATISSNSTGISEALDFTSVMKASQALSSEIELHQLITQLMQAIMENAGATKGVLILSQAEQLTVEAISSHRLTEHETISVIQPSIPVEESLEVPLSVINSVKRSLETLNIDNVSAQNKWISDTYLLQQQPQSLLCLPLCDCGQFLGLLYLENNLTIGAFTEERIEVLKLFCSQAAISLKNAQLYQNLQVSEAKEKEKANQLEQALITVKEQLKAAEFRADVDACLTQGGSLQQILTGCTIAIVQHLDAAFARIWILNAEDNVLELQASSGLYTHINGGHSRVPVGQFKIGLIAQERQPHLTNSVQTDPRVGDNVWAKQEGMVSFAGYPLITDGQLLGVIAMFARHPLTDSILKLLEFVANEIALGIKRKQVEEALIKSEKQLQHQATRLQEALQKLQKSQVQLVQSEKMSALGEMMSGITHEINNPLGFVSGNISQVEEALQDILEHLEIYQQNHPPGEAVTAHASEIELEYLLEDLPAMLTSMQTGVNRIAEISKSMRIFSRADQQQKVTFDLHEGIDSTLLILKHRLKGNEFRPEIKVIKDYGKFPQIMGFPGQLNQVFMNILANAIDVFDEMSEGRSMAQMKQNYPQIMLTTNLDHGTQMVKISIQDNGCGMSDEVKNRIFNHLFTTKAVGKGTGLGLSIARQIVEDKHDGKLSCCSQLGKGTEFVIEIPIGI